MKVIKCDSCNTVYEYHEGIDTVCGKVNGLMALSFNKRGQYNKSGYFDLCPECSTKLVNMLHVTILEEPKEDISNEETYVQSEE